MGDHPRLNWPDVPAGLGMQSLLGILEHAKDMEGTLADIEKMRCAADDCETVLLAVRSKVYPGLPSDNGGPVIITSEDVEARMLNVFGDATAAREVIEDIVREHEKTTGTATPLTGLSWIALLMQFLPVLLELLKKWLESRET